MGHDRSRINGCDDDREPRTVQMIVDPGPRAISVVDGSGNGGTNGWWGLSRDPSRPTGRSLHHRASEADVAVFLDRLLARGVVGKRYWRATLMPTLRAAPAVLVASKAAAGQRSALVCVQAMLANQEDADVR